MTVLTAADAERPYAALQPDPASSGVGIAKKLGPGPDDAERRRRRELIIDAVATAEAFAAAAGALAGAPALRPAFPPHRLTFLSPANVENGLTLSRKAAESVVIDADLSKSERPPLPIAPHLQNSTPRSGSPPSTDSRTRE